MVGLLDQLPRLSEYNPGTTGEGSLDPLGLAAVADRLADRLAPGLRARMSQPRYVTLTAVGSVALLPLQGVVADLDGSTTPELAFEWCVVEAAVRSGIQENRRGLPGQQKCGSALARGERLGPSTYLRAPRVFGFNGVYRPFSIDCAVLQPDETLGPAAADLVSVWQAERGLPGFLEDTPHTAGSRLRYEISSTVEKSLKLGRCSAPATGWFLKDLANILPVRLAQRGERAVLRRLLLSEAHEVRRDLLGALLRDRGDADDERRLASRLVSGVTANTRQVLRAAMTFEDAATMAERTFRHLLHAAGNQTGGVLVVSQAASWPEVVDAAARLPGLVDQAAEAAVVLGNGLDHDVYEALEPYSHRGAGADLVDRLIQRHAFVQGRKQRRMWLEDINAGQWVVRPQYRQQSRPDDPTIWVHPMRLRTLVQFLEQTA